MTGNEYQDLAMRTINKGLTFEEQKFHALHGMVGEIGEIHSIYQKMYQGHAFEVDQFTESMFELGFLAKIFVMVVCILAAPIILINTFMSDSKK